MFYLSPPGFSLFCSVPNLTTTFLLREVTNQHLSRLVSSFFEIKHCSFFFSFSLKTASKVSSQPVKLGQFYTSNNLASSNATTRRYNPRFGMACRNATQQADVSQVRQTSDVSFTSNAGPARMLGHRSAVLRGGLKGRLFLIGTARPFPTISSRPELAGALSSTASPPSSGKPNPVD